ncbi:hypothetical protein WV31_15295 [Magnetospirillum sp. ME-1]|uniref:hypothetical protein n=1 Tax=Magnetospirillum sp. ME-1 TaxID=1639348 RepID=UPI000A179F71|nr:hypothetical protein [Magnetospirillum sp. ME-1]ARJ66942.1 hypothetical protein WV31_15295 [Magnetospirillum sp. ME-1]
MLGPAELREIYDCLKGMGLEPVRVTDGRSPYINPAYAAGKALTKAVRTASPLAVAAAPAAGAADKAK